MPEDRMYERLRASGNKISHSHRRGMGGGHSEPGASTSRSKHNNVQTPYNGSKVWEFQSADDVRQAMKMAFFGASKDNKVESSDPADVLVLTPQKGADNDGEKAKNDKSRKRQKDNSHPRGRGRSRNLRIAKRPRRLAGIKDMYKGSLRNLAKEGGGNDSGSEIDFIFE